MFDIGASELIIIFVVALLVFGPKRLPEIGRTMGKGLAELKKAMQGVKEQMDSEINELKQPTLVDNLVIPQEAMKTEMPNPEYLQESLYENEEDTPSSEEPACKDGIVDASEESTVPEDAPEHAGNEPSEGKDRGEEKRQESEGAR